MSKKTPLKSAAPRRVRKPDQPNNGAEAPPSPVAPDSQDSYGQPAPYEELFPIVGVGASAGGLEAFSQLLRELPSDPGIALVFVQHLDPQHVSMLAELLRRESKMPVAEAAAGARVERDHVYVIPKNTSISIRNAVLRLGPRDSSSGKLTSIDMFLKSLAEDQGSRAVGVLLSGNASDGALGLRAIKASGGITFVQDPLSARFDGMPRAAIAAGGVDFIRTPEAIAHELLRLGDKGYALLRSASEEAEVPDGGTDGVNRVLAIVRSTTSVDFSHYKVNTIRRRILHRRKAPRLASNPPTLRSQAIAPSPCPPTPARLNPLDRTES